MAKNLNLINILLFITIFPVSSFIIKDYLVYRYSHQNVTIGRINAPPPAAKPDINDFASIIENPVFPSSQRKLIALAAPEDDSAKSVDAASILNGLKLLGTFVGRESFVVIEKKGEGAEQAFKVGDKVFDAGTLKEVLDRRAIILAGGREIELKMPQDIEGASAFPASPQAKVTAPEPHKGVTYQRGGGVNKTGEREWVLDQKAVQSALEDIGQVLSDARLTPVVTNGNVEGFLVAEVKPRGIFDAIGLKNGDILKRVNGYEITSPEKAVQVLTGLKGESKIDLDVARNGQKMSFHYEIR